MKRKLLITGGNGLLGAYLVRWFAGRGDMEITATYHTSLDSVPADIRSSARWVPLTLPDRATVLELVEGHAYVIHAAGKVSYHAKDKYTMLAVHQTGTAQIVDACLQHDVKHLVYVGSIAALGKEKSPAVLNESSPWEDTAYSTSYGLSKYLGELEAWRGAAEGLPVSVILPSVILGTGDPHRSSMHLMDRIIHKAPFYPGGLTGFVDVRDVVKFTAQLIDESRTGERWVVSGADLTYGSIYHDMASRLGINRSFRLAPQWLARMILVMASVFRKGGTGTEVIPQSYGMFSYDASKSRSLPGFDYRPIDETLSDMAVAYREPATHPFLRF